MTAPQPGLSPEYAVRMRESMLQGLARDLEITKRVLAAVPDGPRDYRGGKPVITAVGKTRAIASPPAA